MAQQKHNDLASFVESVTGESHLRVETDLGDGFVRLRSSEAERRQAAQDIRSSEDILIELLRNSRDAGAENIFCALAREGNRRIIIVLDDGCGIPASMHSHVFESRVTSKLDSARMDRWGIHGRGMALYSIAVNSTQAKVVSSAPEQGTSILIETDVTRLPEKADQSTFPHFESSGQGSFAMRGPKNLLRTAAEFALEHRNECSVYLGSFTEIAATLLDRGKRNLSLSQRVFCPDPNAIPLLLRLAVFSEAADFAREATALGLEFSERSARRVLDGEIPPLATLLERLEKEAFSAPKGQSQTKRSSRKHHAEGDGRKLRLEPEDTAQLSEDATKSFRSLAARYFLEPDVEPEIRVSADAIHIIIPIEMLR